MDCSLYTDRCVPSRTVLLLDLHARDDTFLGDGALRGLSARLAARGHDVALWRSVQAAASGGPAAWSAEVTEHVREGGRDVVVLARAWDATVVDAVRRGLRPDAKLVRLTAGVAAALDGAFDHVLDEPGLVALLEGEASPAPAAFQPTTARALRAARALRPAPAEVVVEEIAGARPAITGPATGCPFLLDAAKSPRFAALPMDRTRVQTKGCTFCLDNTGAYATPAEEEVIASWLGQLRAIRAARPPGDRIEVLLTDERPHPWLPGLFAALEREPELAPVELLVKSRVDWLLELEGALAEACTIAARTGSVLHVYLVGFESFHQPDLDLFNKGVSVTDNCRAIDALRALSARFPRSFEYKKHRAHGIVLFTPWTTPEGLLENARVMRGVGFDELRAEPLRTRLRLYPRTPLHALAAAEGLLVDEHAAGRGDRAAEQGYDASAPWRFADDRVEAIFRAAAALSAHERSLPDADVLEAATRWLLRWPGLAAVPELAGLPLLVALSSWELPLATALSRLAPAIAVYDRELEAVAAGEKPACLKERIPHALAPGLVGAYRAMGLAAEVVDRHGVDATGGDHRAGDSFAIVAIAGTPATLGEVLAMQRAHALGRGDAPIAAMGALMGYPPCCVAAFEALPDRRDNAENERAPFRRAPQEALAPEVHRLGALRLISHHLCTPSCAVSVGRVRTLLERLAALDARGAGWISDELARPALFLDHARAATARGRWEGDRFAVESLTPLRNNDLGAPTSGVTGLRLATDGVMLEYAAGPPRPIAARHPLLTTPGRPLAPAALAAIGGPLAAGAAPAANGPAAAPPPARPTRWFELTADYRCNQRCVGCYAVDDAGPSMTSREAAAALARGRKSGARWLWLGGGEPTLRRDLFGLVREARRLGYERVKLQTNGMLLAYPEFTSRCVEAGVTEVAFAIKGVGAEHDRLTRTPRASELLEKGIALARGHGLALEGDILLYASNVAALPAMVQHFHALGLAHFRLWLLSLSAGGPPDPALAAELPRIRDVTAAIAATLALGLSDRPDFITSLHTPPCTLAPALERARFHAPDLGLVVANPGGHSFRLEESPIEGGTYLPGCAECIHRPRCGGVRADYVATHGAGEFTPVTGATAAPNRSA